MLTSRGSAAIRIINRNDTGLRFSGKPTYIPWLNDVIQGKSDDSFRLRDGPGGNHWLEGNFGVRGDALIRTSDQNFFEWASAHDILATRVSGSNHGSNKQTCRSQVEGTCCRYQARCVPMTGT